MNVQDLLAELIVVIPAHNEEFSIGDTILEVRNILPNTEIYVIDNASQDNTALISKSFGAKVIFEPALGKGRAFRACLSKLPKKYTAILLVDGDATYEIAPVLQAIKDVKYNGVGMVVGTRISENSNSEIYRKGHKLGNKIFSYINKIFYSSEIKDSLSGWRLMSHEFVGTFPGNSKGFDLETELNAHAINFDMATKNIDVKYRARKKESQSKLKTFRDGIKILASNIKIAFQNRPLIYLGLPSTVSIFASVPLIFRAVNGYIKTGQVALLPSLVVGMSLFIGGITFLAIGYVLQELRRVYISTIRQNYNLRSNK